MGRDPCFRPDKLELTRAILQRGADLWSRAQADLLSRPEPAGTNEPEQMGRVEPSMELSAR